MPTANLNNITINYSLEGTGSGDIIALINGLADDLSTWDFQVPAFLASGYRVLRYDNRGIGQTSHPAGPYTAQLLADDLHALLQHEKISRFHLLGVSMGGMIAQAYALKYPNHSPTATRGEGGGTASPQMISLSLCCTYAQPTLFCLRMFALWEDMAQRMSVADVMRDVTVWAFTVEFFRTRRAELEEFEAAMRLLDMSVPAYLSQLNVIQKFDSTRELEGVKGRGEVLGGLEEGKVLVLAGKSDILIPVVLSRELAEGIKGARFETCKGGHACLWEHPDAFNKTALEFLNRHREDKS